MADDTERTAGEAMLLAAFSSRLRELRARHQLSQEEVAERADGMDRAYLSQLERGLRNPSLLLVHSLARALNVHPRELLVDDWPPPAAP
jgi:transcriptional regulator with XRE-family HTH domain